MANIEHRTRERLDVWLMRTYPDFSRAFLQKLCKEDKVLVDGEPQKGGFKLRGTEQIEVQHDMTQIIGLVPDIDLPIIYEDENIIVINKPAGVLSHGLSKFLGEPSVASFLRQRLNSQNSAAVIPASEPESNNIDSTKGASILTGSQIKSGMTSTEEDNSREWKAEDLRFGIVHRLDRVTSGVMVCAKNQDAMRELQKQFHDRTVKKIYWAIVEGTLKHQEALLDLPLERNPKAPATWRIGPNGKPAQTIVKVLQEDKLSLVELTPKTGRTHQLRVHMQYTGHPIVGDLLYQGKKADRLFLHAHELTIDVPGKERMTFTAPVPEAFNKLLQSAND